MSEQLMLRPATRERGVNPEAPWDQHGPISYVQCYIYHFLAEHNRSQLEWPNGLHVQRRDPMGYAPTKRYATGGSALPEIIVAIPALLMPLHDTAKSDVLWHQT